MRMLGRIYGSEEAFKETQDIPSHQTLPLSIAWAFPFWLRKDFYEHTGRGWKIHRGG